MGLALYYAPDYFTSVYFPALLPRAETGTAKLLVPVLYFAPTYFSSYYFESLVLISVQTKLDVGSNYRDRDAYLAIVNALAETGEFALVAFADHLVQRAMGAGQTPIALITPDQWVESDEVDPFMPIRQVSYTVTLLVREEAPESRYDTLDRLSSIAQNALDGTSLAGGCLPGLTRLRRGRFETNSIHPEQTMTLYGEFSYIIQSLTSHSMTY